MKVVVLVLLTAVTATVGLAAIAQNLKLTIVTPEEGSYVSDRVTLQVRVEPAARRGEVRELTFFADGREVCRSTDVEQPRCAWDAGPTIREHLIRVVATLKSGERLVATSRTAAIDHAESVDVRVVQVNVSVVDRRGSFVRGLTQDRFHVREDDERQRITHFANEEAPLELVLAIDVSNSMAPVIDDLKVAVRQFLAQLKPVDQVTLVAFNNEMFILTRRETDAARRDRAVQSLAAWGGTALYDVIGRALELLSRRPGRRGLVIFSDGEDRSSQTTFEAVDRAIRASDATLFTVALGRGREQEKLKSLLESLAEASGGRAIFTERANDLGEAFSDVLQDLKHQYLLGYESTNTRRDGSWRRLAVDVPGERYRVRARQGYFAAKP